MGSPTTLGRIGVLDKAIAVLDALEEDALTLHELVETTGLSRATAHRVAVALENHGMVRRDRAGRFCLGFRLISLGRRAADHLPLAAAAGPALRALRDTTGESAQLYVVEAGARLCVASLESPHGLRTIVSLGAVLELERGSAGRVLTGGAIADGPGWLASVAEREAGVASVSAPVHHHDGTIAAAVSVSGPTDRLGPDPGGRHGAAVVAAARRIERDAALG